MCTALLSLNQNKKFPIILSFNRDEFYDRESIPIKLYKNKKKNIIFGRDSLGKGSWLGCNNLGKIAFILNLRTKLNSDLKKESRGLIITKYLNAKNNNLFHSHEFFHSQIHLLFLVKDLMLFLFLVLSSLSYCLLVHFYH